MKVIESADPTGAPLDVRGVNVAGAIRLARHLGPGHTIVTVLCDHGSRYQSKLYNPEFLRSKGLPVPGWMERRSTIDPGLVPVG